MNLALALQAYFCNGENGVLEKSSTYFSIESITEDFIVLLLQNHSLSYFCRLTHCATFFLLGVDPTLLAATRGIEGRFISEMDFLQDG